MKRIISLIISLFLSNIVLAMQKPYQICTPVKPPAGALRRVLVERSPNTSVEDVQETFAQHQAPEAVAMAAHADFQTPVRSTGKSQVFITPEQKRFEVLEVISDAQAPQNVFIDHFVQSHFSWVLQADRQEEYANILWSAKNNWITNLFPMNEHVFPQLAPVMREQIRLDRSQNKSFDTPEKGVIDHAVTIEHMVNIIQYGTAYLCLPHDGGAVRINITAKLVHRQYSLAIRNQSHLEDAGWGTLSFVLDQGVWRCIHYFNQASHPQDLTFTTPGGQCVNAYFLEPIDVTVRINQPYGNIYFLTNHVQQRYILDRLYAQKRAVHTQRRELEQYVVSPGKSLNSSFALSDVPITPAKQRGSGKKR